MSNLNKNSNNNNYNSKNTNNNNNNKNRNRNYVRGRRRGVNRRGGGRMNNNNTRRYNNNNSNNTFKRYMRVVRTDDTSMVVTGMDLVYSVQELEQEYGADKQVLTIIPANPAYWVGTRVASIATAYQKFRPLQFKVHYVPMVSYLQRGNVFGGTIWDNINVSKSKIQQTLVTTPGGLSTQACKPKSVEVKCKDNLSKNLYSIGGELDESSNPFYYVAIGVGNFNDDNQRVTPGFFWVSYTYSFKNPVGMNTHFSNLGLVSIGDIIYRPNTTAILCNYKNYEVRGSARTLTMFTQIQIDTTPEGDLTTTYNGDYIPIDQDDKLWVFQSYDVNEDHFNRTYTLDPYTNKLLQPVAGVYTLAANHMYLIWYNDELNTFDVEINGNQNSQRNKVNLNIDRIYQLDNNEFSMFNGIPVDNMQSTLYILNAALAGTFIIRFQKRAIDYLVKLEPIVNQPLAVEDIDLSLDKGNQNDQVDESFDKNIDADKLKKILNKMNVAQKKQ